jgi:exodeoxyribonuclease VII small subunit
VTNTDARAGDVAELSYEQARDQLVDVVQRLEAGSLTLEESLTLWERGEALAARCQEWLDGARHRLDAARGADAVAGAETGSDATADSTAAGADA